MYKERSAVLVREERGYRDNMKRLDDGIEKSSASTSKGWIGKEKDRLAPAAAATQIRRYAGQEARPTLDKMKYPDDGNSLLHDNL